MIVVPGNAVAAVMCVLNTAADFDSAEERVLPGDTDPLLWIGMYDQCARGHRPRHFELDVA